MVLQQSSCVQGAMGLLLSWYCSIVLFISYQTFIKQDNVQEILIAGDMIELQEVVELCTEYLVGQLDASNAIGIFRLR